MKDKTQLFNRLKTGVLSSISIWIKQRKELGRPFAELEEMKKDVEDERYMPNEWTRGMREMLVDWRMKTSQQRISELESEIISLKKEQVRMLVMPPHEVCQRYSIQSCRCCNDMACGDNTSPAKKRITELEAENASLKAILNECEFEGCAGGEYEYPPTCPLCKGQQHSPDCKLAQALKKFTDA